MIYRGTSLTRKGTPLRPDRRPMPRGLWGWAFSYGRDAPPLYARQRFALSYTTGGKGSYSRLKQDPSEAGATTAKESAERRGNHTQRFQDLNLQNLALPVLNVPYFSAVYRFQLYHGSQREVFPAEVGLLEGGGRHSER
jgi:hypothetical protein